MNEEELALYQAFGNFATENLFWRLIYLYSMVFHTPLQQDAKHALLHMNNRYETIVSSIYPSTEGRKLITAATNNNLLFIAYVDKLIRCSPQAKLIKQQWEDNGKEIAQTLAEINPYWRALEWSAMIKHESDLLNSIVTNMHAKNYMSFCKNVPICRRLAIDMSKYMSSGVMKQREAIKQYKNYSLTK